MQLKGYYTGNMKYEELQVGYIALNKSGEFGGYAYRKGFQYTVYADGINQLQM